MLSAVAEHKWLQANQDLRSVPLLTTSGSANNTVKKSEGKRSEDGPGLGQLAWKALMEKYNGPHQGGEKGVPRKTRRHEDGARPRCGRLFFVLDECRDLLEEMGQTIHD